MMIIIKNMGDKTIIKIRMIHQANLEEILHINI